MMLILGPECKLLMQIIDVSKKALDFCLSTLFARRVYKCYFCANLILLRYLLHSVACTDPNIVLEF